MAIGCEVSISLGCFVMIGVPYQTFLKRLKVIEDSSMFSDGNGSPPSTIYEATFY
ncbi:12322_t:CDS:2 [Entrophospora sp. SA101]|nr:4487_t:CDS:2 [Entrophospora sp. SA101]CAJ0628333.1 12322_t:CDS:2 [Entrophospora sp. SA101]CAJ0826641.1 345_t:CDS:2 [Entrophospora sp. SA101]CAJ0879868.1 2028_t:CDS:2 [Entrophospora sp. SA101]CAJ0905585.1 21531_t:CDS:2 [Entrophospora sp. SA101]